MTRIVLSLALVAASTASAPPASPTVREFRVGPVEAGKVVLELVFDRAGTPCGESVGGTFTLFGSSPGVPVHGPLVYIPEGGCALRIDYPFAAIGPDLVAKSKVDALDWSLVGERQSLPPARPIAWSGRAARETVRMTESTRTALRRFVSVQGVDLGALGLSASTVNVVLDVTNPLSFDLRIADVAYELRMNGGSVARGRTERILLRAGRTNRLEMPVEVDHAGLLAALGSAAMGNGGAGILSGTGKLRLPSGDLDFPFEFPVTLSP